MSDPQEAVVFLEQSVPPNSPNWPTLFKMVVLDNAERTLHKKGVIAVIYRKPLNRDGVLRFEVAFNANAVYWSGIILGARGKFTFCRGRAFEDKVPNLDKLRTDYHPIWDHFRLGIVSWSDPPMTRKELVDEISDILRYNCGLIG